MSPANFPEADAAAPACAAASFDPSRRPGERRTGAGRTKADGRCIRTPPACVCTGAMHGPATTTRPASLSVAPAPAAVNSFEHIGNDRGSHVSDGRLYCARGLWHKWSRERRRGSPPPHGGNGLILQSVGERLPVSTEIDSRADAAPLAPLLARVASGERGAFEALYRATSATLFAICLRVLPDRSEAEEALQEAFVAVWNKAAQFDPARASPIAWLGAIARHRAIDRRRANAVGGSTAPIELAESIVDEGASPADSAQAATDRMRLDECLRRLDVRRRTLIRTAFFDAATYEELARRAQAPLGSVKSWIRRGLMQLRTCLES